jgi:hypothetical protein
VYEGNSESLKEKQLARRNRRCPRHAIDLSFDNKTSSMQPIHTGRKGVEAPTAALSRPLNGGLKSNAST